MNKMAKARSCIFQSCKTTHNLNTIDSLEGSANSIDDSAEMDSSANQNDFLEESLSLPRMHSDSEISDNETDFSQKDAMNLYFERVSSHHKDTVKMIAIIMVDVLRIRFQLTDVAAATEASLIAGFNEKTIRKWHHEFYDGNGNLPESESGKHNRPYVLNDENCRKKALSWLHSNAYKKEKSLTADIFTAWINTDLLPGADLPPGFPKSITPHTARRWLHSLGFSPTPYKKGTYYNGHERDDVKEYRRIYLRKPEILQSTPPICPGGETEETIGAAGAEKRLVLLYHDESSFHSNEARTWQWTEKDKVSLRPKGQGRGLMVSDFIDEYCGFLQLSSEEHELAELRDPGILKEARVIFKFGAQGDSYWNNEHFIAQLRNAIKIAEFKYPSSDNDIVFLFDHSSGHCAYAEDALLADKMNVNDGGKQPFLRDRMWDGRLQRMVTEDGKQKE